MMSHASNDPSDLLGLKGRTLFMLALSIQRNNVLLLNYCHAILK